MQTGRDAGGGTPSTNIHWVPGADVVLVSTVGLLVGRTLDWTEKRRFLRFFLSLRKLDPDAAAGMSWSQWMAARGMHGRAAALGAALARLSTYVGDVDRLDAGAAIRQLQRLGL